MPVHKITPSSRRASRLSAVLVALALVAVSAAFLAWRQDSRSGAVHARQGQEALAAGRTAQAEREWRQGVQEDPGDPQCHVLLGDLYLQQQRFPDAVAEYTTATRLSPNDGGLFLRLNRAALAVKDVPTARAAAKRAAELRPDDAAAVGLYGMLEKQYENRPEALRALRRAHALRPDDEDYLHELVKLEMTVLDMAAAERDLAPWLQTHPDDAWGCHLMAVLYEQKPRSPATLQTALGYELRAQAGRPDDLHVASELGNLYSLLNRPADALRVYQAGLRVDPRDEAMLHGLAVCYGRLGQTAAASRAAARLQVQSTRRQRITHLKDLLSLNPSDVASGLELARLQEQGDDDSAAYALLTGLVRRTPADARPRRALAQFFLRHDRPGLAQRILQPDYVP